LFLLVERLDYSEKTIEKIKSERIEDIVKINGEIESVNSNGNVTFITVKQPSYLTVVAFNSNLTLLKGERVEVIGKGEEYNKKMEIIAQRIRVVG
jgi:DNA/RNA endonuclease YhcR with UshA esterase domain